MELGVLALATLCKQSYLVMSDSMLCNLFQSDDASNVLSTFPSSPLSHPLTPSRSPLPQIL